MKEAIEVVIPEGWIESTMGEVAQVVGGGTPSAKDETNFKEGGHAWITPADLSRHEEMYISSGRRSLSRKGLCESSAKLVPAGTVLLSSRAPIGYVAVAANVLSTNQGFKSFICGSGLKPEYVYLWVRYMRPEIEAMGSGSTFMEISGKRCKEIPIVFPPLAEQERFVEKVKALLSRVRSVQKRLATVPDILKRFRQTILTHACSGKLTEDWRSLQKSHSAIEQIDMELPPGWVWSKASSVCSDQRAITYGVIKLGSEVKDGIPTLRSSDVRWLYIEDDHIKRISKEIAGQYERTYLKGGEVLVTVRGTLGGVAVAPISMAGFNISREVAMLPVKAGINPSFIAYAIASKNSQNWLDEVKRGVAYTGVNIRELKELPLPLPLLPEQNEIVRRVHALFELADSIDQHLQSATKRAEAMTQSILAKAFRGELVPTEAELARNEGREYESADQLLIRIREHLSQRAAEKTPRRRRAIQDKTGIKDKVIIKVKRKIINVIRDAKSDLTPEELFRRAGFEPEDVDEFYEELRVGISTGDIIEKRPDDARVYLRMSD